jgi:hypothetical protein
VSLFERLLLTYAYYIFGALGDFGDCGEFDLLSSLWHDAALPDNFYTKYFVLLN